MACHSGLRVQNATELQKVHASGGNRTVMVHPNGVNSDVDRFIVYCDITTDSSIGWHLMFTAFPRVSSPYVDTAVNINVDVPNPTDTTMKKFEDSKIKTILNTGIKQTRTQWWHSSVQYPGTIWADGTLTNASTMYNEFTDPNVWSSSASSIGATYKRRRGNEAVFSGLITSANGGCSGGVGGWSNYYEQSCVQSWFAGCEGGPAFNHACAGAIEDRAEKLFVWAA